jgi:hypothetical protein
LNDKKVIKDHNGFNLALFGERERWFLAALVKLGTIFGRR